MHERRYGAGSPLVLVHGLGSSGQTWKPVIRALSAVHEVVALDLPGFGETPSLPDEVSIAGLADALQEHLAESGLEEAGLVGSSMGARLVLELARRGHRGGVVALDPGGFWTRRQLTYFNVTLRPSIKLVRALRAVLPALMSNPAGRTALLLQFSARPWDLPADLALHELRTIADGPSTDAALDALVHGPLQEGMSVGRAQGLLVIGWGRQDRVTLPSQAKRAMDLFPDARLHWFDNCGHFPHWDQPQQTTDLILETFRR